VAEYTYDSWGNILSATETQASINPFRYCGYYYDEETGFYCLSSRYYDPEVGRFINADVFASTGQSIIGFNMFAYCLNDPVNRVDYSGNMSKEHSGTVSAKKSLLDEGMGGAVGLAVAGIAIGALGQTNTAILTSERSEIYEFAKSVAVAVEKVKDKQPRVHHIVPWGKFNTRNKEVRDQLHAAQDMMHEAEISIFADFNNLMIVSNGLHKSMHTNDYLLWVSNTILATDGTKEGIYNALFYLRVVIASYDCYASGY